MLTLIALLLVVSVLPQDSGPWELGTRLRGSGAVGIGRLPFVPLAEPDERCLELIAESQDELGIRAAGTLILRGRHAEVGIDALLDMLAVRPGARGKRLEARKWLAAGKVWKWTLEFAGDALGRTLAKRLSTASGEESRHVAIGQIATAEPQYLAATVDALAEIAASRAKSRECAMEQLLRLCDVEMPYEKEVHIDWWCHRPYRKAKLADEPAGEKLAEALAQRLSASRERFRDSDLVYVHAAGIAFQSVRDACLAELEQAFVAGERHDGFLLRILGHFRSEHPLVREAYIGAWSTHATDDLESLPCRSEHDEETMAAFRSVFDRVENKTSLADRLRFMGETDARTSSLAMMALSDLNGGGTFLWDDGFRGIIPIAEGDSEVTRVNKLGITIGTLLEEGRNPAEQVGELASILAIPAPLYGGGYGDYHLWGWVVVNKFELDSPELAAAAWALVGGQDPGARKAKAAFGYLCRTDLSEEDLARLAVIAGSVSDPIEAAEWALWAGMLPTASLFPLNAEAVAGLRIELHQGYVGALGCLLVEGAFDPRDEVYVRVILARHNAMERAWALTLIEHYELDSPKLKRLILIRSEDSDSSVCAAAKRIVESRGW